MMITTKRSLLTSAIFLAGLSPLATAKDTINTPFDEVKKNEVLITDVMRSTSDDGLIHVYGQNLCAAKSKDEVNISLGIPSAINKLAIISCNESIVPELEMSEIIAVLPEAMPDGSYRITVNNGKSEAGFEFALASPVLIVGPQGEQGPQGEIGPIGLTGPQGEMGPIGLTGPVGPQGIAGEVGVVGPIGPQGIQGEIGPQGIAGETGPAGPQGIAGEVGAVGPIGPQGIQGEIGPQGMQGATGPVGPQGIAGEVGAVGPIGPPGLQGETGPAGPQGIPGEVGAAGPMGPQGIQGETGPRGIQGETGPTGPAGPQGFQGLAGLIGLTGPQGPAGEMGPEGPVGPAGIAGPAGEKGESGVQGIQGPIGPQGPAGEAGTASWFDGPSDVTTPFSVGIGEFAADTPPTVGLYVKADVAGPDLECPTFVDLDLTNIGTVCFAAPYSPENHAMIVENTRRTDFADIEDQSKFNTGGLAIVLNSFDKEGLNLDPLNGINTGDKFVSFFRKNQTGSSTMVGRIQAMGRTDFDDVPLWAAATAVTTTRNFFDIWDFNIQTTPFSEWIKFEDGKLMRITEGNPGCDGNPSGGFELCVGGVFDFNVDYGDLPKLTQLKSPITGISLDIDTNAVNNLVSDFLFYAPNTAKQILEIKNDPAGWKLKQLKALAGGAGVTYESGNGDYAEWLPRLDAEEALVGTDVVGVFAGKISRNTVGADHVMVVSVKPIMLGNMPPEGEEQLYEKVAFMGQVPVRVNGIVQEGDFLVPSGWEDGTAIGIHPSRISADQLDRIIGVAWESSYSKMGVVNTAVGLQSAEVAKVMQSQSTELSQTSSQVEQLELENQQLKQSLASLQSQLQTMTTVLANTEARSLEALRLVEAMASELTHKAEPAYALHEQ